MTRSFLPFMKIWRQRRTRRREKWEEEEESAKQEYFKDLEEWKLNNTNI